MAGVVKLRSQMGSGLGLRVGSWAGVGGRESVVGVGGRESVGGSRWGRVGGQ